MPLRRISSIRFLETLRQCARSISLLFLAIAVSMPTFTPPASAQTASVEDESNTLPFELRPLRNWLRSHAERQDEVEEVIQTDRPSFTAAHTLVPKGWAQVEAGYQYSHNRKNDRLQNSNAAPQLNLRLGLTDWLEFRNLWAGFESQHFRDVNTGASGMLTTSSNFQTGFKIRATQENGWIPQSALITTVFLPTGYGVSVNDQVSPMIDYVYCWTLTEKLTFTGSTGAVFAGRNGRGHDEHYQSLVFGQEWSDTWSSFFEWYITEETSIHRQSVGENVDTGILWRPRSNLQFDWRIGTAINGSDSFFTGVGLSGRY
jgi:hypothetical protein